MTPRAMALSVVSVIALTGCCGRRLPSAGDADASLEDTDGAAAPRRDDPVPSETAKAEPPAFGDCDEDNKQVYVVSDDHKLLRFLPVKRTFHVIGKLRCPASGRSTPYSMAVDRSGTAYVLYNDGSLFRVSTRDASCKETAFETDQRGMKLFGMAFVTDGPDSPTESLWVASYETPYRLAKLDTRTLRLSEPRAIGGKGGSFELTGRGDGRVFGFDPAPPARVVELSPSSGALLLERQLKGLPSECRSWAVAQYWGDFWVFCGTQLTRYSMKDDSSETVQANTGYRIVGAGVSTCAPSARP